MNRLLTDPRSYESEDGDILPFFPEPDVNHHYDLEELHPELAEQDAVSIDGTAVALAERAFYLLEALKEYAKASRLNGLASGIERDSRVRQRYSLDQQTNIIAAASRAERRGEDNFMRATGAYALIAAGFDESTVTQEAQVDNKRFVATYTGSANQSKRAKSRRVWGKQEELR